MILDFILGIFIFMIFYCFNISLYIRVIFSILALIVLISHSYMLIYKFQQSHNNIFYLSGIITGAMIFLNPTLGSLLGSLALIILSIIMFFRF